MPFLVSAQGDRFVGCLRGGRLLWQNCMRLLRWDGGCGGAGLVHSFRNARVVDVGEAVRGAAPDLGDVSDDLLGHSTPPPLPKTRPEQ